MEKRFVIFIVLSVAIMSSYIVLYDMFAPKKPLPPPAAKKEAEKAVPAEEPADPALADKGAKPGDAAPVEEPRAAQAGERADEPAPVAEDEVAQQWVSLGSYTGDGGFVLQATFNSRGAALERVAITARRENGELRYRNLEDSSGYLGYLALRDMPGGGGCKVNVVGEGTPAALAVPADESAGTGLQPGDVIRQLDNQVVRKVVDLEARLASRKPGDSITLTVERRAADKTLTLQYEAKLAQRPLEVISPEALSDPESDLQLHPLSCLLALVPTGEQGGPAFPSAARTEAANWRMEVLRDKEPAVEFRLAVELANPQQPEGTIPLELVKRYRVHRYTPASGTLPAAQAYHIDLDIELHNRGESVQRVAYRLTGPNGLPLEGWWYSTKIHPEMFHSAGARDVLCKTDGAGRRFFGLPAIFSKAKKNPKSPETVIFAQNDPVPSRTVRYAAVDTQYFIAALMPRNAAKEGTVFRHAAAVLLSDPEEIPKNRIRTANASFELTSTPANIEPGASLVQRYDLYVGPKDRELLETYDLDDAIEYGWFPLVVKPLQSVLHFFYSLVGNYGIAIIMLTILVRGCMFPLSRKAAKNAAMMQELAPEMKKIAEKYKNDMEKRAVAQRELFARHNYNPFSGCWMMFVQLPIFIGLYRCLAIDINLRQAPLIPGVEWASNLSGPDKLFNWEPFLPGILGDETGWLGPYFNVLPIVTIALFLVQQKLFTPPATDEQTRMQMTVMKYMTVFIGVMFYKVPSGLCLYFIASSIWSIAERKLLPKKTLAAGGPEAGARVRGKDEGNGPPKRPQRPRRKPQ